MENKIVIIWIRKVKRTTKNANLKRKIKHSKWLDQTRKIKNSLRASTLYRRFLWFRFKERIWRFKKLISLILIFIMEFDTIIRNHLL